MNKSKKATGAAKSSPKSKKVAEKVMVEPSKIQEVISDSPAVFFKRRPENETKQIRSDLGKLVPNSWLIDDYDDNIMGFDAISGAVIYDGEGMVMNMAQTLFDEKRFGNEDLSWDDYCDIAQESVEFNVIRGIETLPEDPERPKPIVLVQV